MRDVDIKSGIKLHTIKTDKFKTNLIAVFLTSKLDKKSFTENVLISSILRRGCEKIQSSEELAKELEEMYGAEFDSGIDKTIKNHVFKFYIESVNDAFLPKQNNSILHESIDKILNIVFKPLIDNNGFKEEYVVQEKRNIKQKIEGKKDNKARYATDRIIEEMYKDSAFGMYRFGDIKDLDNITSKSMYKQYKQIINNCKIDIYVSGNIEEEAEKYIINNEIIKDLPARLPDCEKTVDNSIKKVEKENIVWESSNVTQGKLVIGLEVGKRTSEDRIKAVLYNSILGGSANSKMFQNVREKAQLCYIANSSYLKYNDLILINSGIEIVNYDKALELIKVQIEEMRKGEFTEDDILNAKKGIIDSLSLIEDEQDSKITYYYGQEINNSNMSVYEYIEKIRSVTKEDIVEIANSTKINTIYFLKD